MKQLLWLLLLLPALSYSQVGPPSPAGPVTSGDCVMWVSAAYISDAGAPCGSGGGGGIGPGTVGQLCIFTTTVNCTGTATLPAANEPAHTGDVTNSAGSLALTIANSAVTLAKQANFAASSLMGNPTGSAAAPSAITLGSGLSFSGTTLVASGGGSGTVTSVGCGTGLSGGTITTTGTCTLNLGNANTWTAAQTFTNSDLKLLGSSTGATTFTSANSSATNFTLTVPAATDTLVTLAATQTLTNKSIATTQLTGALQAAQSPAHTGDVTNTAGSLALTIANSAVTLAKQANFAASSLQGNPTGSAAAPSAITLGSGLSFSGTTLVASGGSATSITPGTTTVVGATAPCLIDNSTSTTMGCAAIGSTTLTDLAANTTFTVSGTGCTPSAHTGSPFGGTITLASGPCTSLLITINGATGFTAPNGYHCNVGDRTAMAAGNNWIPAWTESATTTTTVTLPVPGAAGATDVVSFTCDWY